MLHFILNPAAGGGRARAALGALQAELTSRGLEYQLHFTERPGHATAITRALPGLEPVIAVGGDGTLSEVVAGLLHDAPHHDRPLGIVPLGTGDDFARGFALPVNDLHRALDVLWHGKLETIDAGRLDGRVFVNGIGSGFDAQVASVVKLAPKFLPGPGQYLWAIIAELARLELRPAHVLVDGQLVHDGPALLVAVMNLTSYGGGLRIAPTSSPRDGLLDVVIGGRFGKAGALGILPRLAKGQHLGHPEVRLHRGQTVRVEWAKPTAAHMDGELLEPRTVIEASLLPNALRVFAP